MLFLCCFPHSGSLRAANPEFPFHGFWKAWFSKNRTAVDFYYKAHDVILRSKATWESPGRAPCKSDETMFLPVGKSDVAFGAMCVFGTLWIKNCYCERKNGDPAGYCVPVGKRSTQAKDWALLLAKMWFQKRRVRRISRKGILEKRYGGGFLYGI